MGYNQLSGRWCALREGVREAMAGMLHGDVKSRNIQRLRIPLVYRRIVRVPILQLVLVEG